MKYCEFRRNRRGGKIPSRGVNVQVAGVPHFPWLKVALFVPQAPL